MTDSLPSIPTKTIFGHPAGLFVLFFTEMWERFSFYGMKALLIFYLVKYHLFNDDGGNLLVGSYAAMVYALPVIGGYLADKYLGFRKAVVFGGVLLVLGHLGMVFEGSAAVRLDDGSVVRDENSLQFFYFSLALIILGVGFLKANISSIVGELYAKGDARRDSGFTIFYMGINIGSALATLICGWLGESYGWSYGFGAAGIGMIFGLITFIRGKKHLLGKGEPSDPKKLAKRTLGISTEWWIYILSILSLTVIWQMVQRHTVVEWTLVVSGIAALAVITYIVVMSKDKVVRERLIALTILIIFSVFFWALFEQAYTSMNLFSDRAMDRMIGTFEVPTGWYLTLNAVFIVIFAPVFAWLWVKLGKKKMNPNAGVKFGLAIVLVGLGFGALVLGFGATGVGKVSMTWLVLAYLLHTWGELCLSPVGLSNVTKLAPAKFVGFMMGVWFLATAFSEYIASVLANFASLDTTNGNAQNIEVAKSAYGSLFVSLFYIGLVVGVILIAISPLIKRLMHGVDDDTYTESKEAH